MPLKVGGVHLINNAYRYGGDEFILLYRNIEKEKLDEIILFLLERFNRLWPLKGFDYKSSASIGVAFFPDDRQTIDGILNNADKMMYMAKENGRGRACFPTGEMVVYTADTEN